MAEWHQGIFSPKFSKKVLNENAIYFRSSYELRMMNYLDLNDNVIRWGSEVIVIPYVNEVDGKKHRYVTDFYAEIKQGSIIKKYIIEVKPMNQCEQLNEKGELILPRPPKKKTAKALQNYLNKCNTIRKNHSKWSYAREFCKRNGLEWLVITECDLYPKG